MCGRASGGSRALPAHLQVILVIIAQQRSSLGGGELFEELLTSRQLRPELFMSSRQRSGYGTLNPCHDTFVTLENRVRHCCRRRLLVPPLLLCPSPDAIDVIEVVELYQSAFAELFFGVVHILVRHGGKTKRAVCEESRVLVTACSCSHPPRKTTPRNRHAAMPEGTSSLRASALFDKIRASRSPGQDRCFCNCNRVIASRVLQPCCESAPPGSPRDSSAIQTRPDLHLTPRSRSLLAPRSVGHSS
jgi:hypothetical protein